MAAEPNSWEQLLRKMLPEGAPLPDEDQLDYSISVDYVGPPPFFNPPVSPMIPKTRFTPFPKQPLSLTPRNPSWLKSSSTCSDDIRPSANSANFIDVSGENYSDGVVELEAAANLSDRDCPDNDDSPRSHDDRALRGRGRGRKCNRCGKRRIELLKTRGRCIVCGAEYCKKCVVKAMGSMPEGRKCVGCIGKPIDEANRGKLGKGSRVLSSLCSRLDVRKIMQVERECKANQVKPEQVIVNGRELREEELDELLGCQVPPKNLKPGRYWYDKDSGFWGKEGEKPDRIISSKLYVGGKLQIGASNGRTRVYMNGRVITKVELRLLKLANVQCPRNTHFWLYEDGSYEEEGQNIIKGNIWKKASVRFICSLFSLAVPPEHARCAKKKHALFSSRLYPEYWEQDRVQKLLLIGLEGSGTSTIFKQAKLIYTNKFSPEELQKIKLIIQTKIYRYLSTLLEATEHFEDETFMKQQSAVLAGVRSLPGEMERDGKSQLRCSVDNKISTFSEWLLELMATGDLDTYFPAAAREYAPLIDEIWKDPAIQETYKRREELLFLPDVAKYFLDRALEISSNEYEPSETDILFAEGVTPSNGLACFEFTFDDHSVVSQIYNELSKSQQPLSTYQLILLSSPRLNNGCKWLEMLEGTNAIIFCVSLLDYNQHWTLNTGHQQNKMEVSRDLFERVARNSCFENTPSLLLLTQYDMLEDKINEAPLTVCEWFDDFKPLKIHGKSTSLAPQAFHYIATKFKDLYVSITGRKLYVHQVIGQDRNSVDEVFRYAREILDWDDHKDGGFFSVSDEDAVSCDETNSPPCDQ